MLFNIGAPKLPAQSGWSVVCAVWPDSRVREDVWLCVLGVASVPIHVRVCGHLVGVF
jgi:hypothetical protein